MTLNRIKIAIYSTFLTNFYGLKLKKISSFKEQKEIRINYAKTLLKKLNIKINILNKEKMPQTGQFLLISNHRSIIDPLILELATENTEIFGHWIAKKELYNSFFFGTFVRNSGTILLDRSSSQMGGFFKDIKNCVKKGLSIYIFPEGTRNKQNSKIADFKEGSRVIAIKNRLPILPIFIKTQADQILNSALKNKNNTYTIDVEIGDIIDYKDRELSLENAYKKVFHL